MKYQDNDPERRNLVITSFAFILFSWGEGSFRDGNVNFQIVNLHFDNTVALGVIAWGMLLWFLYRYWLKYSGTFNHIFLTEISKYKHHPMIKNYCEQSGCTLLPEVKFYENGKEDGERGYLIGGIGKIDKKYHIHIVYAESIKRDLSVGKVVEQINSNNPNDGYITDISFDGIRGRFVFLRLYLIYCFKENNFSSHVVPFILFYFAVISGVVTIFRVN